MDIGRRMGYNLDAIERASKQINEQYEKLMAELAIKMQSSVIDYISQGLATPNAKAFFDSFTQQINMLLETTYKGYSKLSGLICENTIGLANASGDYDVNLQGFIGQKYELHNSLNDRKNGTVYVDTSVCEKSLNSLESIKKNAVDILGMMSTIAQSLGFVNQEEQENISNSFARLGDRIDTILTEREEDIRKQVNEAVEEMGAVSQNNSRKSSESLDDIFTF